MNRIHICTMKMAIKRLISAWYLYLIINSWFDYAKKKSSDILHMYTSACALCPYDNDILKLHSLLNMIELSRPKCITFAMLLYNIATCKSFKTIFNQRNNKLSYVASERPTN